MTTQTIRDNKGVLLGTIKLLSDGKHELRNNSGILKGTYNPKTSETRDSSGRLVSKGNMLAGLL